jgi:DNA repair ATPase RecN
MKNRDLYTFKRGLDKVKFDFPSNQLKATKNKRLLMIEINDIEKLKEPDDEYKMFDQEKSTLAEHYAKELPNGSKITQVPDFITGEMRSVYNIPDINDENSPYRKELLKLEKKYKDAIERYNEKIKKFQEFLDEESTFQPIMVNIKFLDEHEKFDQDVMDRIFWMINEPKT